MKLISTSKYEDKAIQIARLVEQKNEAYGNSFEKTTEIMKILYPEGIAFDSYQDVLTIVRILDKINRIATHKDTTEDPYSDICGYALLELAR